MHVQVGEKLKFQNVHKDSQKRLQFTKAILDIDSDLSKIKSEYIPSRWNFFMVSSDT